MVISSLIVETMPDETDAACVALANLAGVEVHGKDPETGKVVVTIEADSIDESHKVASSFLEIAGVRGIDLIYANFEDENLPAEALDALQGAVAVSPKSC